MFVDIEIRIKTGEVSQGERQKQIDFLFASNLIKVLTNRVQQTDNVGF